MSLYSKDIAIVGIGCRFPGGVSSPETFQELIFNGIDAITEVPEDRWSKQHFYAQEHVDGKARTKWGGFIDAPHQFDAPFFGYTPVEVASMDPQQRLLLEVFWESMEDAGINPYLLKGSNTGVFIGAFTLDHLINETSHSNWDSINAHTAPGSMMTLLSNRISYLFDLNGPSITLDTACSSSLIAVHLAVQSILNGECDSAVAGGVNLMLNPGITIAESKANMLSPTGRSRSFDSQADGYVRGEGAGLVVLKPLAQAVEEGDRIYAVIKGSATNQDGKGQGQTVPNGLAQQALVEKACAIAGIHPNEIQYVEAHGTGTPVGDPIEANALGNVLGKDRTAGDMCYLGSVKSNFGHTEAAAGVAGLIKTALCMKQGKLPKIVHFKQANAKIDFAELHLKPLTELSDWPNSGKTKLAGVNSFGFGGSNCHIILGGAPELSATPGSSTPSQLKLPISAKSETALKVLVERFIALLSKTQVSPAIVCANAARLRAHHEHRVVVTGKDQQALIHSLQAYLNADVVPSVSASTVVQVPKGQSLKTTMVLSGMGPQWWAMGRQLLESEAVFAKTFADCDKAFARLTSEWSLKQEFTANKAESRMQETQIAQTSNFALQVSLAELYRSRGVTPDILVGHSVGETAAAYISGSLSLEDAALVVFHRSRLQQTTKGSGGMLAVGVDYEKAQALISAVADKVAIAAINGPTAITLAGDIAALEAIAAELEEQKIFQKFLRVEVPYHSPVMDPLKEEFLAAVQSIKPQVPHTTLYSTVTGARIQGAEQTPEYWWRNLRDSVYFSDAINHIIHDENSLLFYEVGPHPVLGGSINQLLQTKNSPAVVLSSLRREEDEQALFEKSISDLYVNGFAVDWSVTQAAVDKTLRLPLYPWQKKSYRSESDSTLNWLQGDNRGVLLGRKIAAPTPTWALSLRGPQLAYLFDHNVQGNAIFPAAGYVEMALEAINSLYDRLSFSVHNLVLKKAIFLSERKPVTLKIVLSQDHSQFNIYSRSHDTDSWQHNGSGELQLANPIPPGQRMAKWDPHADMIAKDSVFSQLQNKGFQYGPQFQLIQRIQRAGLRLHAELEALPPTPDYHLHPAILDAGLQAILLTASYENRTFLPTSLRSIEQYAPLEGKLTICAQLVAQSADHIVGEATFYNEEGLAVLVLAGVEARPIDTVNAHGDESHWVQQVDWQEADQNNGEVRDRGDWIIFSDHGSLGPKVGQLLFENGNASSVFTQGQKLDLKIGEAPMSNVNAFIQLLAANVNAKNILWLWPLEGVEQEPNAHNIAAAQQVGVYSLLALIKAIEASGRNIKIWPVTRGMNAIGSEPLYLQNATLAGFSRVLSNQELPGKWQPVIDLDSLHDPIEAERLVQELLGDEHKEEVALRNGKRYVARLVPHKKPLNPLKPKFSTDSSYMITGGLGDLGALYAEYLIAHGANNLVLQIRTALPPREQWASIDPASRLGNQIQKLQTLEASCAQVKTVTTDITNADALLAMAAQHVNEGHPPIRHVVHCAGVVRDKLLASITDEDFDAIYQAKVYGSWAIHEALGDQLESYLMFSSYASVYGAAGQSNYASANSFMDSLAHYRRAQGRPALAINFGPWTGLGMAKHLDLDAYFANLGIQPITRTSGLKLFRYLHRYNSAGALVAPTDWTKAQQLFPMGVPGMMTDLLPDQTEDHRQVDSRDIKALLASTQGEERIFILTDFLQQQLALTTKIDAEQLNTKVGILDLGLDSLLSTTFKFKIESEIPVNVSLLDLLKGPSLELLAAQIAESLTD